MYTDYSKSDSLEIKKLKGNKRLELRVILRQKLMLVLWT